MPDHRNLIPYLEAAGFPEPQLEYQFHHQRKWRFDLAWPQHLIAVEIQGGVWTKGRHTRGKGYVNDCDKLNSAQLAGWRVLWTPTDWWKTGAALDLLQEAFDRWKRPAYQPCVICGPECHCGG